MAGGRGLSDQGGSPERGARDHRRAGLALVGIEGFEDVVGAVTDAEPKIAAFLEYLVELAGTCARENLFAPGPIILSAGGSKYFDQVTAAFRAANLGRPVEIVLRSGCYLSHDSRVYTDAFARLRARTPAVERLGAGLRPALELWASVQSMPQTGLAILTMGKRDVSHDIDLPLVRQWFRPGSTRVRRTSARASRRSACTISTRVCACPPTARFGSATS